MLSRIRAMLSWSCSIERLKDIAWKSAAHLRHSDKFFALRFSNFTETLQEFDSPVRKLFTRYLVFLDLNRQRNYDSYETLELLAKNQADLLQLFQECRTDPLKALSESKAHIKTLYSSEFQMISLIRGLFELFRRYSELSTTCTQSRIYNQRKSQPIYDFDRRYRYKSVRRFWFEENVWCIIEVQSICQRHRHWYAESGKMKCANDEVPPYRLSRGIFGML